MEPYSPLSSSSSSSSSSPPTAPPPNLTLLSPPPSSSQQIALPTREHYALFNFMPPQLLKVDCSTRISLRLFSELLEEKIFGKENQLQHIDPLLEEIQYGKRLGWMVNAIYYDVDLRKEICIFKEAFGTHRKRSSMFLQLYDICKFNADVFLNHRETSSMFLQRYDILKSNAQVFLNHRGKYPRMPLHSLVLDAMLRLYGLPIKTPRFKSYEEYKRECDLRTFMTTMNCRIRGDRSIGFDKRKKKVLEKIRLQSNDALFIGISGTGGIGKTYLARWIYESLSSQYEHRCFLTNVADQSEKGNLLFLQKELLSHILINESVDNIWNVYDGADMISQRLCDKRCFIVIDDVDDDYQLTYLAKSRKWFGPGSRIVITSRNKYLLKRFNVDSESIYDLQALTNDEALSLLSMKAFGTNEPPQDLMQLCNCIVKHTSGLPLALEIFASALKGRPSNECMLLMPNVKDMGRRIVEEHSYSKLGKDCTFWSDEISCLLVPRTECMMDIYRTHDDQMGKKDGKHITEIRNSKTDMKWILTIIISFTALSSAVFDQLAYQKNPHYALIAMIISFSGVFLSLLELVYEDSRKMNSQLKEKMKSLDSFPDIFGFVSALCQYTAVTINYTSVVHLAGSPSKIWSTIFSFLMVFSKFLEARGKARPKQGKVGLHLKNV